MKKILALVACLSLVASLAIGGSIAYLTDRDSEANVFTFGDVSIDLKESFGQGSTLVPGVNIEKKPVVTNTGDNDAWVWMTFSIPTALDNAVQGTENGSDANVIHWNPLGATTEDYVTAERVANAIAAGHLPADLTAEKIIADKMTWNVFNSIDAGKNHYQEKIKDVDYTTYVMLYNKALTPGETTLPSLFKVYLDPRIDIDPEGNWHRVENGNVTDIDWGTEDGKPIIYVSAYAIQKEGFNDVKAAYAAYNTQWGDKGTEYGKPAEFVDNVEDLMTTIQNGGNVVVPDAMETIFRAEEGEGVSLDAKGATVTLNGVGTTPGVSNDFGYLGFVPANGEGATVENLNVTGSGFVEVGHHNESTGGTYIINNLNVTNMTPTLKSPNYGMTVAAAFSHYGNATMTNCVMTGVKDVEGASSYDAAFPNKTNTTIEGGKYGKIYLFEHAKVTIKNAEIDTIDSRAMVLNNLGQLVIGSGTHVGTINLIKPKTYDTTLTIESGATVDKIIYDGTEYTQAEWLAR